MSTLLKINCIYNAVCQWGTTSFDGREVWQKKEYMTLFATVCTVCPGPLTALCSLTRSLSFTLSKFPKDSGNKTGVYECHKLPQPVKNHFSQKQEDITWDWSVLKNCCDYLYLLKTSRGFSAQNCRHRIWLTGVPRWRQTRNAKEVQTQTESFLWQNPTCTIKRQICCRSRKWKRKGRFLQSDRNNLGNNSHGKYSSNFSGKVNKTYFPVN